MRLIATRALKEGAILAKPVYNERGQVLISDDVPLTTRIIRRLSELGITYVYIKDRQTEDIVVEDTLSEQTRHKALKTIESTFEQLKQDHNFQHSFLFDKAAGDFVGVVRNILSDLKNNQAAVSLLSEVIVHDDYIFTHSLNVTIYALALGMEMNLPSKKLEEIGIGAILHDVGKMLIPLKLLRKPGRLSDDEFGHMKKHAEYGFDLLRKTPMIPLTAAHCAYQHHERLDGSGYPRGLQGKEIHLYGKIIAIADVFDAVTSNRVYRNALLPHDGLELLYAGAGTLFDKDMVDAFRKAVVLYPVGLTVYLSDGRSGVVSAQNKGYSTRPIVRILEEHGQELTHPYELNLRDELSVMIAKSDTAVPEQKFMKISL